MASGTDLPDVRPAADLPADTPAYDVVVVGLRHRRWLRGAGGGAGRRVGCSCSSGPPCTAGRRACPAATSTSVAGRPCRRRPATTTTWRRWSSTSPSPPRSAKPDKIRAYCEGAAAHLDWLEDLGFEFERSYYPEKAVIQPGTAGADVHRQREGLALPRPGRARAARPQGAGARRHRGRPHGHGPAAGQGRRGRRRGPLRDRRLAPGRPTTRCRGRRRVALLRRDRLRPRRRRRAGGRWFRDEPGHGRRAHPGARAPSCSRSARRTTTGWASGWAPRSVPSSSTWTSRSSPRRSTRRPCSSRASS